MWFLLRSGFSGSVGMTWDALASVISAFPAVILTIAFVPSPAPRWPIGGFGWSLMATVTAMAVPFALCLGTGLVSSREAPSAVGLAVLAMLLYAVHEEVLFRLFLADVLSFRNRFLTGALLSSALFTAVHLNNPFSTWTGMANIFLAGFGLCLLRALGGGMAGAVTAHFLWNAGVGTVMGMRVSGYRFPAVFRPASESPGFGPEAEPALTAVLTALVIIGLVRYRRRERLG